MTAERTPWYAALITPPPSEDGFRVHGLWISQSVLQSPEGVDWPPQREYQKRLMQVLEEYAAICQFSGIQFPIVSGYRTFYWQGTFFSYLHDSHCRGYALDLAPAGDWTVPRMAAIAKERYRQPGSRLWGVGANPGWLHIDVRPRQRRKDWKTRLFENRD